MLAHQHGLALITEKLQNQRLEEPAGGSSGVAPSAGSSTSSSFCGKLPAVSQDTFLISDHPGQSATALSVKGKNVWTLSLEADRISQLGGHHTDATSGSPSTLHHTSSSPRSIMHSVCRHKKLRHLCQICDTAPGTPSAPPKKKHCRSLSVPPDGPSTPTFFPSGKDSSASPCTRFSIGIGSHGGAHSSHHHHHHQSSSGHHASKIWRPIAVVPLRGSPQTGSSNCGNSSGSSKMSSSSKTKGGKERISTSTGLNHHHHHHHHHQYHHYPPASFSHAVSATMDADSMNNNDISSSSISTSVSGNYEHNNNNVDSVADNNKIASLSSRFSSCSSSSLLKHKLMPPSSSSSASFDSGHFTTSDLQTPPSSPIPQPRPASAASDASYSSIGWFDFSPMRGRLNILQNRSLSCEDRISACCSCCSSSSPFSCSSSSTSAGTTTSMPSVYNYNSSNKNVTTFGDCDNVDAGSVNRAGVRGSGRGSAAACCSHHSAGGGIGEVVPRCHSQPCVLHHRRYGKKRRRECDRPTLNFNKMTETAYVPPHPHRRSEPWSSPSFDAQMRSLQGHYAFNTLGQNQQNLFYLNPIASSPLDTSEPLMSRHHSHQQQQQSASGTRIDPGSERLGQFLETNMTINLTPPDASPGRQGLEEDEEDEEEEEEDDEDERNCSCHDNQKESDSIGVFPMGDLEDLDLEQIETH